jgi:PilZ domain-containing protein
VALPERAQTVTLVPRGGKGITARVLERGPDALQVAIMVPVGPLGARDLDGLVLEFVAPQGRVRLSGTATIEDPSDPDVLRIDSPRSIEVLQEREYVRIRSARPAVVYAGPNRMAVESYTVDLSGGGFLLAGPDTLKIGEEVRFTLTLKPKELVITGTGEVVRVDRQGHRAVAFKSIAELDRRRLIRFIFDCQRAERQRGLQNG